MDETIQIDVIIGPTASGKSAYAIDHALQHDGVIINADSMQVYDPLPILTAQPSAEEQAQAPHQLYSVLDATESCGAQTWRDLVIPIIEQCHHDNKRPILVGGSGFYINALMRGFSAIPDIPIEVRLELMSMPLEECHCELEKCDPEIAQRLHPNDGQRTVRALEVFRHTGKPLSEWQKQPLIDPPANYNFHVIALMPERDALYDKINKRVHHMMDMGVMDEVKALTLRTDAHEVPEHMPVIKAHGFRPLRKTLKGQSTLEDAIEQTQQETRNYAKRQMTWLRHQIQADKVIEI